MDIFLQFKHHFHDQSYFSIIVIHFQLFPYMFNIQEAASKTKAGGINLTNM